MTTEQKIMMSHLNDHVVVLFIALARIIDGEHSTDYGLVWKCKSVYIPVMKESHFAMGIGTDRDTMVVYHIPNYYLKECSFANTIETLPPKDNTHPSDISKRVLELYPNIKKRWE